ncbi:MAG: hypothetical protein LAT67_00145 [Balneolales bacterium]|nr:hypothetical protein [Balneolales bacterium]
MQEKDKLETFIQIQLGKTGEGLSLDNQIEFLKSKFKKIWLMLLLNVGVVLFFSYSFYYEITRLSTAWLNAIMIFFAVNVFFLFFQWRQLKKAIVYLEEKRADK